MATTAIWPIRGRLDRAIAYIKDQEKTYNPAWEQGSFPALSSLMQCAIEQAAAQGMGNAIGYVINKEKTDYQYYVSGIRCDPQSAREAMALTKRRFQKEGGIVLFHGYQSFKPGEVTPEQAHEIGVELANRLWGDRFEVVIATHLNTGVLHKERLAHIQERIEAEQVRYEPAHEVRKTMAEIEGMGQKTLTGKIAVSKDDYQQLTALAKEGITSRSEIQDLKSSVSYYQRQYFNASSAVERLQERYDRLKEKCQPFLQALEHFPKLVEVFVEKVKELFSIKEAQERKEREDRAAARKEQSKHRRGRNDWER